jgi:hypothetical protein
MSVGLSSTGSHQLGIVRAVYSLQGVLSLSTVDVAIVVIVIMGVVVVVTVIGIGDGEGLVDMAESALGDQPTDLENLRTVEGQEGPPSPPPLPAAIKRRQTRA